MDVAGGSVEGRETVTLKNSGRHPLGVVAFDWAVGAQSTLEVYHRFRKGGIKSARRQR